MLTKQNLKELVVSSIQDFAATDPDLKLGSLGEDTELFGGGGFLGSLGLVSVLVTIEEEISDREGLSIVIADERALSQTRSPFRTVGSLIEYLALLVTESKEAQEA